MLKVAEIFYSLQGEGARAGEPSLFIRLSGCSAKHACYQAGIRCDTEFESGSEIEVPDLIKRIHTLSSDCHWVIWTGGEPLDQLTEAILKDFTRAGYAQALETSGVKPLPAPMFQWFDHITVSPKVAEHVLLKHFAIEWEDAATEEKFNVHELRYVRHTGQDIPQPGLVAQHYYLSPHSDGLTINKANLEHCIQLCLDHPQWKLSVQQHKFWNVL